MKLFSYQSGQSIKVAVHTPEGLIPLETIASREGFFWSSDVQGILSSGKLGEVFNWLRVSRNKLEKYSDCLLIEGHYQPAPLLKNPGKIIGIGLNYAEHARDLSEKAPREFPGSFIKPATTIIGHGDVIQLPAISKRTTGEAELALVIGKPCRGVPAEQWKDCLAGFTVVIDMTAEDILRKNPRFLTLSKSFDSFLSIGSELITAEEIDDAGSIHVETVFNGEPVSGNLVRNMTFPPDRLIQILSGIMTLMPGDIILTGTPGAVALSEGDIIEARVSGFLPLVNPVKNSSFNPWT
jgi:2-keto-4-pentenoate hydratase/2-oxohepta-3-ene-1,7-dioic acid hydratase in catechol pathway